MKTPPLCEFPDTTILDLLKETRRIFADHGGAKNELFRNGKVCLRGALFEAWNGDPVDWGQDKDDLLWRTDDLLERKYRSIKATCGGPNNCYNHVDYNNLPETTKEDVLSLIDDTIADLT